MAECTYQKTLSQLVDDVKKYTKFGRVADYIPALGEADPDALSVAIYKGNGSCIAAGCIEEKFTLQSISKVLTLALAIMDRGEEYVFSRVGMEPTGDPFNSIAKLESNSPSKPLNPMINAGALAVTNMIIGRNTNEKLERILALIHEMTSNTDIGYCNRVAHSEFETAFLNRSLCYFMKQHKVIEGDIEELLDLYTKQCAILVNCHDLSKIGYVIANEGRIPQTGKQVIPQHIVRIVNTFMVTCGMYNSSGEFAIRVGIPAKSGVSGGIMGSVPRGMGIGIYGPALDERGNSYAGMKLLESLSIKYDLSIF
ncbi:glutaminase A [Anaerobacillus alkalilacustris]|uniref:Glutaminase n=1 Tax=Anaerobacillus alkalilacustris TaxID=393763 RepID=A0A1S2LLS2_9BACI|nr:glutaminase A [Anaerobacillus alkalilacustris]OIJ13294.1 glutaminase A [Anaerobacillus alkalilacustris]